MESSSSSSSSSSPFRGDVVKGKVALITGGGSGIGFEISAQLGKHGASVAIMGRRRHVLDSAVSALTALGIPAIGLDGDVRKKEDAIRIVEATFKHFGRLDILVNAAAGNFLVPAEDLSPNGFRTVIDIDSVGTFTMCHEALKYLKKGGPGRGTSSGGIILNISATLHYTASWYQIHVSAAKAAVDSITRSLALEWGTDYDIRVNGIAPGPIDDTPGLRKLAPDEMKGSEAKSSMPLYKSGEKWDIAMAALYLASDAGKYINGTTLVVDGGLWLSRPRHISKETVRELSRVVERKSREAPPPARVPTSKLFDPHEIRKSDLTDELGQVPSGIFGHSFPVLMRSFWHLKSYFKEQVIKPYIEIPILCILHGNDPSTDF
ncbi:Short-chain dehydrogenase/reductase SDR [Macleaya cordata]|uniref:Secoisolariciresinol dehydrogenase n=1 Tax=Macleaya cordata TaxID=56857 RepID=A0A200QPL8_MACCD|nr:Short-chain dehydrogenase/reductase SDR [Macleaya cordata]